MKGVLSKRQRERKRKRESMSKLLGDRMNDWRTFIKKTNDSELSEKEKDDREGAKLLEQYDEKTRGLISGGGGW